MKNFQLFAIALLSIFTLASCSNTLTGAQYDLNDLGNWVVNKPAGPCPQPPCNTYQGMREDAYNLTNWTEQPAPATATAPSSKPPVSASNLTGWTLQPALPANETPANTNNPPVEKASSLTDWTLEPALPASAANKPPVISEASENTPSNNSTDNVTPPASPHKPKLPKLVTETASVAPVKSNDLVWHTVNDYDAQNPTLPADQIAAAPPVPKPVMQPVVEYNSSVNVFPVDGDMNPYMQVHSIGGAEHIEGHISGSQHNGGSEMVQQVFFAHGSAKVSRVDHKNLHELAQSLVHNGGDYKLDVIGHASKRVDRVTDPIEKKMINFKMAQKRADAVTEDLLKAGVSPDWVVVTSEGDDQPNQNRDGKTQEAADRRAEVFLNNTN